MKIYKTFFLTIFLLLIFFYSHAAIICGRLHHFTDTQIQLEMYFEPVTYHPFSYNIQVNNKGIFHFDLDIIKGSMGVLKISPQQEVLIYLEKGDSLFIEADINDPDSMPVFSNNFAGNQSYCINRLLFNEIESTQRQFKNKTHSTNINDINFLDFVNQSDSSLKISKQNLDDIVNTKPVSPYFYNNLLAGQYYRSENFNVTFPKFKKFFSHASGNPFTSDYIAFIKQLNLNIDSLSENEHYLRFVNEVIEANVFILYDSKIIFSNKRYDLYKHITDSLITSKIINRKVTAHIIYEGLRLGMFLEVKHLYRDFIDTSNDILAQVMQMTMKTYSKIQPGDMLPKFEFTDIHGKPFHFGDLKGQLIYIDFWASWCGGCIIAFPNTKKLQKSYKNNPVQFVFISLDEDEKTWKESVKKFGLKGVQLRINGKSSEIAKYFDASVIPKTMLANQQGIIISNSAPNPGSEALKKMIDANLAE